MAVPVIFDTDVGSDIDDLYALALILRHPNLELLGVTTAAGDTQGRARIVAKMLRLAGRSDVPVYAGIQIPEAVARRGVEKADYRRSLSHARLVQADDPESGEEYGDAVPYVLEALNSAASPVTIIGTGPWTNIAEVLRRADQGQRSMIDSIALMGGEIHLLHCEANVRDDPEAADQVLRSQVAMFVGTWSVTRQLYFTMAEVEELTEKTSSPFLRALCEGTKMWWGNGIRNKPGPVCYDVVPVFWAAGDRDEISCIGLESLPVELEGVHTRGITSASPWQLMAAETVDSTSSEYVAVTNSLNAGALKKRYQDLVFE